MEKDDIIKIAEELYKRALDANSYYAIIMQYSKLKKNYEEEMQLSPAFFNVTYSALQKACFMELAKLFEASTDVVSIQGLLECCNENKMYFSEYREEKNEKIGDEEWIEKIPYQHCLQPSEECLFKEKVAEQREIAKILGISDVEHITIKADMTFSEKIDFYWKCISSYKKKIDNIRIQRNKFYAHNDKTYLLSDKIVWEENPVEYEDIKILIDFALECTIFILELLTDIVHTTEYTNIDDLEGTLMLVKKGLKYQNIEINKQLNKYK